MADERTDQPGERRRGRVESAVLRIGVIAGAVAGIAGAVTAVRELWPDEPAKRAATFENVTVVPRVPLSEYNIRVGAGGRTASVDGGTLELRLVAQETGAAEPEAVPEEPEPEAEPEPPPPSEEPEPEPEPEPGDDAGPSEPGPGGEPSRHDVPPVVRPTEEEARREAPEILGDDARAIVAPDGTMEIRDPEVESAVMGVIGEAPEFGDAASRDRPITAEEVVAVFKATRSVRTAGGREPVGVTVDFDVGAVGYEGDRLDVRWTLYGAATRRRVPREWLDNRRALLLEPDVDDERGSATMWVPLPRARGPWFVRLSLFDSDGRRLTFVDTHRFG